MDHNTAGFSSFCSESIQLQAGFLSPYSKGIQKPAGFLFPYSKGIQKTAGFLSPYSKGIQKPAGFCSIYSESIQKIAVLWSKPHELEQKSGENGGIRQKNGAQAYRKAKISEKNAFAAGMKGMSYTRGRVHTG